MTVNKITTAPTPNETIGKINEIIDNLGGGGGTATDVQINGTSITSNNVANIVTNSAYNASSNKIATMSDVPSVDSALSSTSTNPVQNKVINSALAGKYDASNPNGYTSNVGTVTSVNNTSPDSNGNVTLSIPTVPTNVSAFNNDSGYITGINSSDVNTALGYGLDGYNSGTDPIQRYRYASLPSELANFDGQWVNSYMFVSDKKNAGDFTINLGTTGTNHLDYLPQDNYSYLVQLAVMAGHSANTTTASLSLKVENEYVTIAAANSGSGYSNNSFFVVVDSSRSFDMKIANTFGVRCNIYAIGYRRVGTNT